MVDSSYPPGVLAGKGSAVRRLKRYVSWVKYQSPTKTGIIAQTTERISQYAAELLSAHFNDNRTFND